MHSVRDESKRTFSVADLCAMFGFTARQIQDLRAKGALQPPDGSGRGARYTDAHIQRLGAIKPLLDAGVSVARIASRYAPAFAPSSNAAAQTGDISVERWDRVQVCDGLEISFCIGKELEPMRQQLMASLISTARQCINANADKSAAGRKQPPEGRVRR